MLLVIDVGNTNVSYGVFDGKLIWASEPKALLAHPSVNVELDLNALRHYVSFDYVPAPFRTIEAALPFSVSIPYSFSFR